MKSFSPIKLVFLAMLALAIIVASYFLLVDANDRAEIPPNIPIIAKSNSPNSALPVVQSKAVTRN